MSHGIGQLRTGDRCGRAATARGVGAASERPVGVCGVAGKLAHGRIRDDGVVPDAARP